MKTVLITGVGRGIGKALAQKFLSEGFTVIGTTRSGTTDFIHPNFKITPLDLSHPMSISEYVNEIKKLNYKIDILINNAGVLIDDEETHLIPDKLQKTLDVNLLGTANLTEQLIPLLSETHIVFLSSQAGSICDMDNIEASHFPYHYPAYKISKCALNMYIRTLAARLTHEGSTITISAVHPGWVRTEMGGDEAPVTAEEAAADIFKLALSHPETGQFWYKGNKYPW